MLIYMIHDPVLLLLLLENRIKFCYEHTFSGSSSRSLVADYSRFRMHVSMMHTSRMQVSRMHASRMRVSRTHDACILIAVCMMHILKILDPQYLTLMCVCVLHAYIYDP